MRAHFAGHVAYCLSASVFIAVCGFGSILSPRLTFNKTLLLFFFKHQSNTSTFQTCRNESLLLFLTRFVVLLLLLLLALLLTNCQLPCGIVLRQRCLSLETFNVCSVNQTSTSLVALLSLVLPQLRRHFVAHTN